MKLKYIATLTAASILTISGASLFPNSAIAESFSRTDSAVIVASNPCAAAKNAGQFVAVKPGNNTEGTFKVVEENGKQYIELSDDFAVSQGPDLKVILHKDPSVESSIAEEDYINIAPLASFAGGQKYEVPDGIDVAEYASVAIWCEEFNVTFGYAPFKDA